MERPSSKKQKQYNTTKYNKIQTEFLNMFVKALLNYSIEGSLRMSVYCAGLCCVGAAGNLSVWKEQNTNP